MGCALRDISMLLNSKVLFMLISLMSLQVLHGALSTIQEQALTNQTFDNVLPLLVVY